MSRLRVLSALALAVALVAGATVAFAAESDGGTVSPSSRSLTWAGADFADSAFIPELEGPADCAPPDADGRCDHFALTVEPDAVGSDVEVQIAWPSSADDFDLYVFDGDTEVASSAQSATTSEVLTIPDAGGVYEVRVVPFAVTASGYVGGAESAQVAAPAEAVGDFAAFLKGVQTDEANSAPGGTASTSTFGPQPPDDPTPVMQSVTQFANRDFAENFLGAFWTGPFTGTLDEALELTWFFSSADGTALTQVPAEVTVFADPPAGGGVVPAAQIIGRQPILLNVGPTPTQNISVVPVNGTAMQRITIQVALTGVAPNDVRVLYDSASTPSRFREVAAPPPSAQVTPPGVDGLPAADAQGLEFSATVPSDHQRDESEPLIEIDPQGNAYGCGPSGAGTFDFSQVSTDGGDQFHILGAQPVGAQTLAGGGDCQIALDPTVNANGAHDYAYVGLGPLTSFAVAASDDTGRTLDANVINGATIPGVDRQWGAYVREDQVLLSYNQQQPRQIVVQRSLDSGRTYLPAVPASSLNPSFPGPMRSLPAQFNPNQTGASTPRVAYFGWNNGSQINLSMSTDGGSTWTMCKVADSLGDPTLFVTVDHDDAGTIYVVYGEEATFHTYLTSLPVSQLTGCNQPVSRTTTAPPSVNPGFTTPVQVDRGAIRTSLFPWVTAGGAPGRVAVAFYGTESDGNPNLPSFKATWDVYVNQSLNAADPNATFSQVKATTHPFHYDSICLEGLGCSISGGDRSLADFFAIDTNPENGELLTIYDQGSKRPDDAAGSPVATPAVVRQIAGPSLLGDSVTVDRPDRQALRTSSGDPLGDAEASYSALFVNPGPQNQPAADFTGVSVGPEVDLQTGAPVRDGGFTVTMQLDDLSLEALEQEMAATESQSLLWVWRYVDGYRASAVSARWNPSQGFTFGHNGYRLNEEAGTCATPNKCIQYPGDTPVAGAVDQEAGTIRLSVPRGLIAALDGPTGPKQRPAQIPATAGSRIYDGVALSLGNVESPMQERQGLFYTLDGTPAMDFLIGDAPTQISIGDVGVPEGDAGDAPASFAVTLSEPVAETVTVDYATADGTATAGSDYAAETGTVTFAPEQTAATVEIDVTGDTVEEADETFTVTLSDPTGGAMLARETGTATILDDDAAGGPETTTVSVGDASTLEGGNLVFTVRLSAPRDSDTTVEVDTADGTARSTQDYAPVSRQITIPAGETSETVTVESVDDDLSEPSETFAIILSEPPPEVGLGRATGTGTIDDDEARPGVSVDDATVTEFDAGTTQLDVAVRLSGPASETIRVDYATDDGTATSQEDYVADSGEVVFEPGSTERVVTVRVVGDTDDEPDETFGVTVTDVDEPARVEDGRGDVTIVDDDQPPGQPTEGPTQQPTTQPSPSEAATEPTGTESPSPTPAPTPGPGDDVDRIAGGGRIETSVLLSGQAFPDGAPAAVLARADDFPDALAAATLAAEIGGPVLLTGSDRLADEVAAELRRLGAGTVYLVGGSAALSPLVEQQAVGLGLDATRLAGPDRFVTADQIGREVARLGGPVDRVIVARADDFPDALSAANLATYGRAPILLTATNELSPQTEQALDVLLPAGRGAVYLAGGEAVASAAVEQRLTARGHDVERLAGATRFDTAAAILAEARRLGLDLEPALVANGFRFPDALAAGPAAHALEGGLLLVDPEDATRSPATLSALEADREAVDTVIVVGGEQAIAPRVDDQLANAIADG